MEKKPYIYNVELSKKQATTKDKLTITVVVDDMETNYAEMVYTGELIAGEKVGVM